MPDPAHYPDRFRRVMWAHLTGRSLGVVTPGVATLGTSLVLAAGSFSYSLLRRVRSDIGTLLLQ